MTNVINNMIMINLTQLTILMILSAFSFFINNRMFVDTATKIFLGCYKIISEI